MDDRLICKLCFKKRYPVLNPEQNVYVMEGRELSVFTCLLFDVLTKIYLVLVYYIGLDTTNSVFEVSDKLRLKQVSAATDYRVSLEN